MVIKGVCDVIRTHPQLCVCEICAELIQHTVIFRAEAIPVYRDSYCNKTVEHMVNSAKWLLDKHKNIDFN